MWPVGGHNSIHLPNADQAGSEPHEKHGKRKIAVVTNKVAYKQRYCCMLSALGVLSQSFRALPGRAREQAVFSGVLPLSAHRKCM
jgi:hypothetical protein